MNGHADTLHWTDFCEEHASYAASDFYRHFRNYLHEHPDLSNGDVPATFLNVFLDHFKRDFYQCIESGQPVRDPYRGFESVESFSQDRSSPNSSGETETQKSVKKSFLRRLSFRKKARSKENKDGSGDEEHRSKSKQRNNNIKKDGLVYRLIENSPSGPHKWEKCRLVLVNNASGYLLECYSPPKVCVYTLCLQVFPQTQYFRCH